MRRKRPGAHFFTFFNQDSSDVSRLDFDLRVGVRSLTDSIAAPRCDHTNPRCSWANSNPSAYFIDSGLWTACRESREAMERRFRALQWTIDVFSRLPSIPYDKGLGRPANATFKSNGEIQQFTTYPGSDLFCLQPFDIDTADWPMVEMSIFQWELSSKVAHLALEYNPTAASEFVRGGRNAWSDLMLDAASNESSWVRHLWLIDYRLRRKANTTISSEKRHEFFGNKCKYVEADEEEWVWERGMENDEESDVFNFIESINGDLDMCERRDYVAPIFKVLACEDLD